MPGGPIKSAARVLEILEYFAQRRAAASVSEICAALGYPQSSTSMLLRSLQALGYLDHDLPSRTYRPTLRVTRLGDWIEPPGDGLLARVRTLARAVQETVVLVREEGLYVRIVQSVEVATEPRVDLPAEGRLPLDVSAGGLLFLARQTDAGIDRMRARLARVDRSRDRASVVPVVSAAIVQARDEGVVVIEDLRGPGVAGVAVLASVAPGETPLAIEVVLPVVRLHRARQQIVTALVEAAGDQTMRHPGAAGARMTAPAAAAASVAGHRGWDGRTQGTRS